MKTKALKDSSLDHLGEGVDISKLLATLKKLKPFLEDECNYLGIYEHHAKRLCKILGWKREVNSNKYFEGRKVNGRTVTFDTIIKR